MLLAGATAVGVGTATFLDPRRRSAVLAELVELVRASTTCPRRPTSPEPWRHETMTEPRPRDHLVLALDVGGSTAVAVRRSACAPWFATVKVGLELYAEAGPAAFARFHDLGFRVFADLKLHDIPTTVGGPRRSSGAAASTS